MLKKYSVLILSLFINVSLFAQNFTQNVRGKVTDAQSGSEIPGVMIQLLEGDSSNVVLSDIFGNYKLQNVPIGRVDVLFMMTGFDPVYRRNLIVASGKELILNIKLEESVNDIQVVQINVKSNQLKPNNKSVVNSSVNLNPEQTQKFAGTLMDVSRMAANYAGIVPSGDQRNDIIVRGNSPLGIVWRLEGVNIPNPNHFGSQGASGGPISILNNNNLSSSDFMTGAFPAEYGNGISGAFDLKMRNGNNEKVEYTGMVGFNGFEVGIEGPFSKKSKASYMINYRYSTLGVFDALGISFGFPAIPQYQDVAFKINLPTNGKLGRFQLFGIGGTSYIALLDSDKEEGEWTFTSSGTDVTFGTDIGVVGLSHKKFITKKSYWSNTVSLSTNKNDIASDTLHDATFKPFTTYLNESIRTNYSWNSVFNTKFNAKHTTKIGLITDYIDVNFSEEFYSNKFSTWLPIIDFKGGTNLLQSYVQHRYKPLNKLVMNGGVHYQRLLLNGSDIIEPRASVKYELTKKQSLSLASGLHSQMHPLRVYLLETNYDDGASVKTNKNLDFTKSLHLVLGYNYMLTSNLRFKTETYHQSIYDTPVREGTFFSIANAGADFIFEDTDSLVNSGTGNNMGVEFTLEKVFNKNYYYLINASFYDSKYVGGDGVERNTAFNGNYTFNALGGYEFKISKKSVFTLDFKFASSGGKRYLRLDLGESIKNNRAVFDNSSVYELKFDDYYRLDMKAGFRVNTKKITHLFAFDVQNITNRQNIFREVFDAGIGELKQEYQLGLFPVFLYKISF